MYNYEAPTEEVFQEMKEAARKVWKTYDNEYGYVDEKLERVDNLTNIQDNAMVLYRMFDHINQSKMVAELSNASIEYIKRNN